MVDTPSGTVQRLETVRVVWTVGTGFGLATMLMLLREVMLDDRAIRQVSRPGIAVLQMTTRGEIVDQCIRTVSVGSMFLAGLASLLDEQPRGRRSRSGVATLLLLMCSAASQVFLATVKLQRRRSMIKAIRLNRMAR